MNYELTLIFLILMALILMAFVVFASSHRLSRERRASQQMRWRTDDTVRAERAAEVHDRDTHSAETGLPRRERRPLRPGPDNLRRFK